MVHWVCVKCDFDGDSKAELDDHLMKNLVCKNYQGEPRINIYEGIGLTILLVGLAMVVIAFIGLFVPIFEPVYPPHLQIAEVLVFLAVIPTIIGMIIFLLGNKEES
jgi:high-affinity K+ transport system ATPase subunit B